jgi:hypothetical protein
MLLGEDYGKMLAEHGIEFGEQYMFDRLVRPPQDRNSFLALASVG